MISFSDNGLIPVCFLMTITANELSGKAEDFTGQECFTRVMGLLTGAREYEVRERIPPRPMIIVFNAPRLKVIFNIGPMVSVLVAPVPMASRRTNRDAFYK